MNLSLRSIPANRRTIGVALALAAMAVDGAATAAAGDPLASYYGNTVHETRADGSQTWLHFNADLSFSGKASNGRDMSGTYSYDLGSQMNCLQIAGRPAGGPPACAPLPPYAKIGAAWDQKGPDGKGEHFVLERGQK